MTMVLETYATEIATNSFGTKVEDNLKKLVY